MKNQNKVKKVDILEKMVINLEKMVINDGEMIKKLRDLMNIQQKAIDNLDERMDLLAGAEFKTKNIKIENGDETITISKREFLEKCAKIGAKMKEEGNIADPLGSAMYAALIAFELFDKDKEEK